MGAIVTRTPQAWVDLADQAEYIARHSLKRADRFLDAAEATFLYLAQQPDIGVPCEFQSPEAAGMRWWRIRGHKRHLVFYRPTTEGIDVVRVLHGARDIARIFDRADDPDR